MPSEPTVVYSAASVQQAYLLRSLLEDRGIKALVVNDAIQIAGGELPLGWTAAARVVVAKEDADEARRLAEEFDQPAAQPASEREAVPGGFLEEWADWPRCPRCGARRLARCPICHTSGGEFPLADYQENGNGQRVLLVCATCDDHMLPEWHRSCAQCGHDFGQGIAPTQTTFPTVAWDPIFGWVVAAALALTIAAAAYFWWLFA